MRAIQIQEFGGPEVLVVRDVPEPTPPDGFVVVDVAAAGINYADTHQAENSYLAPAELPLVPGGEVVGTTPDGQRVVALVAGGAQLLGEDRLGGIDVLVHEGGQPL